MKKVTLTISTDERKYSVQGSEDSINAMFDAMVITALNGIQESETPQEIFEIESISEKNLRGRSAVSVMEEPCSPVCTSTCKSNCCGEDSSCNSSECCNECEETSSSEENKRIVTKDSGNISESNTESENSNEIEQKPRKYKGFMIIKCQKCGTVKAFYARNEIDTYKCHCCGGETKLDDVVPLTAICECGEKWRYMTNIREDSYELNCLHCGSPIPVFFNLAKKKYETIVEGAPKFYGNKKKKGGKK